MKFKVITASSLLLFGTMATASNLQENMQWIDITNSEFNTQLAQFSISLPITKDQLETAEQEGANYVLVAQRGIANHMFRQDLAESSVTSPELYAITTLEIGQAYCQHISPDANVATFEQLQDSYVQMALNGEHIADYGWPFEGMSSNYYRNISIPAEEHSFIQPTEKHIYQFIDMHVGGSPSVLSSSKFGLISCVKPL
ncbi:hypothetical protein ACNO5M_27555 [Vibrio owensii]|uniref:hypothetical protein n=1 Tax=Vibrio owensii TaxID=696485 RepID=UPI003AAFB0F8